MASGSSQSTVDQLLKNGPQIGPTSNTANTEPTSPYAGNVPNATIRVPVPVLHGAWSPSTMLANGYKKGDQFALLPTNSADLTTLQQALVQAGYLNQGDVIYGSPDAKTVSAFEQLLATANLSGVTWQNALGARLAAASQQAPAGVKTPPLTIALTNPDDIKAVAQKTAQTLLGQNLPDDALNAFVSNYQAAETKYQTDQYYQQYQPGVGYGPGGTTTQAPNLASAAEQQIRSTNPIGVSAYGIGSKVMAALDSLRSTGNLPNG